MVSALTYPDAFVPVPISCQAIVALSPSADNSYLAYPSQVPSPALAQTSAAQQPATPSSAPSTGDVLLFSTRSLTVANVIQAHKAPLSALALPSLYLYTAVVALKASDTVLEAMRLMSECGVSSVAVVGMGGGEEEGRLLSAVSVTDVGKVRVCFVVCGGEGTDREAPPTSRRVRAVASACSNAAPAIPEP